MKKVRVLFSFIFISALFLALLSGCGGSKDIKSFKDVPLHPQAEALGIDYFIHNAALVPPWSIVGEKVLGGPFDGYSVDGQNYYHFTVTKPNPSLKDFYAEKFSGWDETSTDITDELTGLKFTLITWAKGDYALVVLQSPDMFFTMFLKK